MPVHDCGNPNCELCQKAFGPDRAVAIAQYRAREQAYAKYNKERSDPSRKGEAE